MKNLSVNALAELTGIDRRTIIKRLAELKPAETKGKVALYLPPAAFGLIFGSSRSVSGQIQAERLRLIKSERETAEINLATLKEQAIPVDLLGDCLVTMFTEMRQVLINSDLDLDERDQLFDTLRGHLVHFWSELRRKTFSPPANPFNTEGLANEKSTETINASGAPIT